MRVSEAEWGRLAAALEGLDAATRAEVIGRVDRTICAFLDRSSGACLVYAARPLACRAFGFHLGRDGGRWCATIEGEPGLTEGVLLGNHDALERACEALGDRRTIGAWMRSEAAATEG